MLLTQRWESDNERLCSDGMTEEICAPAVIEPETTRSAVVVAVKKFGEKLYVLYDTVWFATEVLLF